MKNESSNHLRILIKPENQHFIAKAQEIAIRVKGDVVLDKNLEESGNRTTEPENIIILLSDKGIELKISGNNKEKPIFIDFSGGKIQYRQKNSGTRKEAIARAVGLKSGQELAILDATAGLGGDSFILASLGAKVTMLERNPLIHLLLEDAINRAKADKNLKGIMDRMELISGDAIDFLTNTSLLPDVVYMDPMFPDKTKTALNKKEMRLFREIAGSDSDIGILLERAMGKAGKRVVVKRPIRSPYVNNLEPSFKIEGKSSRFDVYIRGGF